MAEYMTETVENCLEHLSLGSLPKLQTGEYRATGKYPVIDQGQGFIAGWTDDERGLIATCLPVVIFGDHTRVFKYVEFPFVRGADGTQVLKPREGIDTLFFYYACRAIDLPGRGYNRHFTILKEKTIPIPHPEEQREIGMTLRQVEDAIEVQTKELIITEGLKRAAMRDLFTRGLRGEEQKETEIGLVPESWEAKSIGAVTTLVYRYPTYYGITYRDTGVPEIRGELLTPEGELETDLSKYRFIDDETAAKFPNVQLSAGDIVMSVRGTMGKIGIAREAHVGAVITANLIRLVPSRREINPNFFKYALLAEKFSASLDAASPQTTIKAITASVLKSLKIPVPLSLDEQREIVEILDAIDKKIDIHKRKRAVLEELFKTLLHKLMTGEIRVADLDLSVLRPAGKAEAAE